MAGVLSWILPGLGSFYAGNSGHGVRHLVIEGVGFGVFIAGAAQSTTDVFTGESSGGEGLIATGLVVLVVNGVWSIVAAVTDANGYNRRAAGGGRNDGALQFRPAVRVLSGNSASLGPSMPRAGLEVVRLSF